MPGRSLTSPEAIGSPQGGRGSLCQGASYPLCHCHPEAQAAQTVAETVKQ